MGDGGAYVGGAEEAEAVDEDASDEWEDGETEAR